MIKRFCHFLPVKNYPEAIISISLTEVIIAAQDDLDGLLKK
jgi:hypothetical protein